MIIEITADLNIVPYNRPRFNSHGKMIFNPKRYTEFKKALGMIAKFQMEGREPISGAFKISAEFYKKTSQNILNKNFGDLDNFLKSVLDSLEGICFINDAQCVEIGRIRKFNGEVPKIFISIEEVEI